MRSVMLACALLLATPVVSTAQDRQPPAERDSLEARVRARMAQVLRTQLGLNDEQMTKLAATNRRFEADRRRLTMEERRTRFQLRQEMSQGDSVNQARVGELLDAILRLQRERLTLVEQEQRELATFLTPRQRAQLFGLEEQLRRRMEEMGPRDRRRDGPPLRRP